MLISSLLPEMLMGFKLMHRTHRVRASTCKQLIGDEGEDFSLMRAKMEKEKEKLAILQSDSVNEHVIRDEWSKHVSTRINCKIFPSKRSKKHD